MPCEGTQELNDEDLHLDDIDIHMEGGRLPDIKQAKDRGKQFYIIPVPSVPVVRRRCTVHLVEVGFCCEQSLVCDLKQMPGSWSIIHQGASVCMSL